MNKIVILQSMSDAMGGITSVNIELSKYFDSLNYKVYTISLMKSGYNNSINYPKFSNHIVINPNMEWGITRKSEIFNSFKNFKFINCFKLTAKRIHYKIKIQKCSTKLKKELLKINPDYIINSHYELLNFIPKKYLKKTIMHFHTNFNEVLKLKSYRKYFNKYKNKIFKFVWLTKATCDRAIKYGYINSTYIYNPVRICSEKVSNVISNKNLIFMGRFSKEKRISLMLKIFDDISNQIPGWKLHLYGSGSLDNESLNFIKKNSNIIVHGKTDNIKSAYLESSINLNTSKYEGFSMTILEANEFGVPTISFNFGESSIEQIQNNVTGIIIEQKNIEKYEKELIRIINNSNELLKLSLNCKKFNKQFLPSVVLKKWIYLFEEGNDKNDQS